MGVGLKKKKPVGVVSFGTDRNKMDVSVVETVPHIGWTSALFVWHIETIIVNSEIISIETTRGLPTIFFVISFFWKM